MCSRPAAAPPTRPAQWPARRHASTEHSPVPSAPPEPHLGHACPRLGVVRLRNAAPVPSHHQPHGSDALERSERHETPDPVRSDAVDSRFHGVRQQADAVWLQYRWCYWGESGSCVSASPARQAASSSNGGTRAGPGQSQRQPAGTMLRPTSLRPTSRRTGFRAAGGAGVRSGTGGLGSRCPERRPGQCRGQRPPGRRPRCAPRGGYCPCGRRHLHDCYCPRVRRSCCRPCAGRCPCGGNAPARRPCPPMRASPVRASPVRAERACPSRRSAAPRDARPRPRRWPR